MPNRHALHAYISDDAHDRWHAFAGAQGTSITGLIEAIGLELPTRHLDLDQVVPRARAIDVERRRRSAPPT